MRTGLLWALGAWLVVAAPILAQSPQPSPLPSIPPDVAPPIDPAPPPPARLPAPPPGPYQYWVGAEYLAYWVKNAPQPLSLVTGSPANPTQELLSGDQSLGTFSGFRIGGGTWFDPGRSLGWDGNFFWLQQRTSTFSTSSDATGNPTLAIPFTNQTPGAVGDTMLPIASPGTFVGSVQLASMLQLWGAETNAIMSLLEMGNLQVVGLAGFRYLNLHESLTLTTVSSDILTSPNTVLSQSDQFGTRNQFYGGQIGSRINWRNEWFGIDLTGKLALGATHQSVAVGGSSTQTGPGGINGTFPGGLFAQTSNMGRTTGDAFSIVPSFDVKFSVFITSYLRAFVGYDFLYWSQVVRPGNQIDRNVNLTQSAVLGSGTLLGPASPMPLFNRSDFWAQGLNLGFELRF